MSFLIKQEKFEGPLELLLELIEKEKLSISEISLAKVTDEYVAHIRALGKIDPERLAEFLVVAAQLMLIKSRTLLPSLTLSEEEESSIEELERRLMEYKKIKEVMKDLQKLEQQGQKIYSRQAYEGLDPIFYPPPKLTLERLAAAFADFLKALPKLEKLAEEKIKKIISLEDKIKHIRAFLIGAVEKSFSEIVRGAHEKIEVIVSFLAILELAKQRFVDLEQRDLFSDITVRRINGNNTGLVHEGAGDK